MAYKSSSPTFISRDAGPNLTIQPGHLSAPRSFTSPQKSKSLTEFRAPGCHTAPVLMPYQYEPRSKSDGYSVGHMAPERPSPLVSRPAYAHNQPRTDGGRTDGRMEGHPNPNSASVYAGVSSREYLAPSVDTHNQPHSFPQRTTVTEQQSKPYHSLDSRGNDSELGTPVPPEKSYPPHHDAHQQVSNSYVSSAKPRPYPSQYVPGKVAPELAATRAVYSNTRSYSDNTMLTPALMSTHSEHQKMKPSTSHQHIPGYMPIPQTPSHSSQATLENERYSLDGGAASDHSNEDRHFSLEGHNFKVFGVFDGHDGPRAVGFASNYMMSLFDTISWRKISVEANPSIICEALAEFFRVTEKDFFGSIQQYIEEKKSLQMLIPQVWVPDDNVWISSSC